ncbi:MAG TPA: transferase, partial [Plasticicumulans sp.]|nr:transferase [Plasticicumulans sp.]
MNPPKIYDRPEAVWAHTPDRQPFLYMADGLLSLHFEAASVQSRMDPAAPARLTLGYTRTMMGAALLLLGPVPGRIAMIGLGGGSLVKYCRQHLPEAVIEVAEISAEVIALRERFCVPADSDHLRVLCTDGAAFVATAGAGEWDLLLVDGFGPGGQPPQLGSQRFYDDCRAALGADGLLVANLAGSDPRLDLYLSRLETAFGRVLNLPAADSDNR